MLVSRDAHMSRTPVELHTGPRLDPQSALPSPERSSPGTNMEVRPTVLRDLATVVLLFLAWRGLLFGVDYLGRAMSAPLTGVLHYPQSPFWDGYIRLDSLHYAEIIRKGYYVHTEGRWKGLSTNASFFPLYPSLVKAFHRVKIPGYGKLFESIWPPGLILSNASFVLALFYMLRIARLNLNEDAAQRSLVYLLAFPSSFFFSAFYTESLFLLTTTASFYYFLTGRYLRSGCWGLLAASSRSPGFLLFPAFLLGHIWTRGFRFSRSDLSLLWLNLIPCGLVVVMGILYWKVGDPFAFSKGQVAWGRSFTPPYQTLWTTLKSINWSLPIGQFGNTIWAIEFVSSIAFLALPFALLRGHHKALPIYAFLVILMPLTTGTTMGMVRYEVIAFPSFFVLASLGERRSIDRLLVFASALLLIVFKLAFANGYSII
jgi:Gpi18-like mannosyltransferase